MHIRSKIERVGGSFVTLDQTEYHFAPNAEFDGAHVALVEDQGHLARFLSIPEGYELIKPAASVAAIAAATASAESVELSAQEAVEQALGGVSEEPVSEELTTEEPVSEEPAATLEPQDVLTDPVAIVLEDPDNASDQDVAAAFEQLAGRAPNTKAKRETIIDRIQSMAAAEEDEAGAE